MQDLVGNAETTRAAMAGLVAFLVLVAAIALAWPWLHQNASLRRLREQIDGVQAAKPGRTAKSEGLPTEAAALRSRASEPLARIVRLFRVSEQLNNGQMVAKLQQGGYRGRAAAVKYVAARVISPIVFLGVSVLLTTLVFSKHLPLWQDLAIVAGGTVFGYFLPPLLLQNRIDKRKVEIGRAWPDAVDLLLICVETGMSIEHAFKKVAEEMAGTSIELAKEMGLTHAELSYLQERRQAYENMSRRVDLDIVQAVMSCLIQAEKYGTSLGVSLRVLAQESREMRMAAAEKKAAALPPKLTVPMILFFLPVLFAVIITPAALQISGT